MEQEHEVLNDAAAESAQDIYLECMVELFDEGVAAKNLGKCQLVIQDLRFRGFEQAADRLQTELASKRLHE